MLIVVSDAGPLFYLAALDRLSLLPALYGRIHVPERVWQEVIKGGEQFPRLLRLLSTPDLPEWLEIHSSLPLTADRELALLDEGERQAILLAGKLGATLLLIDEAKGRAIAQLRGFEIAGTLGVLLRAKDQGLLERLRPEIERLRKETTFYLSDELHALVLAKAGEA